MRGLFQLKLEMRHWEKKPLESLSVSKFVSTESDCLCLVGVSNLLIHESHFPTCGYLSLESSSTPTPTFWISKLTVIFVFKIAHANTC